MANESQAAAEDRVTDVTSRLRTVFAVSIIAGAGAVFYMGGGLKAAGVGIIASAAVYLVGAYFYGTPKTK